MFLDSFSFEISRPLTSEIQIFEYQSSPGQKQRAYLAPALSDSLDWINRCVVCTDSSQVEKDGKVNSPENGFKCRKKK